MASPHITHAQRQALLRRYARPPVGTSEWGKWMLAKRGGYARQRQCRALGVNPSRAANAARLARSARAGHGRRPRFQ